LNSAQTVCSIFKESLHTFGQGFLLTFVESDDTGISPQYFTLSFSSVQVSPVYIFQLSINNDVNIFDSNKFVLNTTLMSSVDHHTIFTENSSNQRLTRFNTVFINYDYKTGHYLGN
jgi:hypothetical protein